MTAKILYAGTPARWDAYRQALGRALSNAGVDAELRDDFAPQDVDYIVYAPNGVVQDFAPFTNLKAVLSLWAGVDKIAGNPTLKVPLTRLVDHGLTRGMVEWVTGHTLRHHLGMDRYIHGLKGAWDATYPPLAQERNVTVLGLGELGRACAEMLAHLGFNVTGWSRTAKDIPGLTCTSGSDGLKAALSTAEILVLLLPNTPATESILNAETLAQLPKGAVILNPGRGKLIDDDALLASLESGHIGHATLDTFRVEPLPPEHPYWHSPRVTITPHIAAETRLVTSSEVIAENIRRAEAGEPLLHQVDRSAGY